MSDTVYYKGRETAFTVRAIDDDDKYGLFDFENRLVASFYSYNETVSEAHRIMDGLVEDFRAAMRGTQEDRERTAKFVDEAIGAGSKMAGRLRGEI